MNDQQLAIINHALGFLISNWDEDNEESLEGVAVLADVEALQELIVRDQLGY